MSGKADCTLASASEEGQGKGSREAEFVLCPQKAINKVFSEKVDVHFPTYLVSLKTEVTSPKLGPIVNLAARERWGIRVTSGTILQHGFTINSLIHAGSQHCRRNRHSSLNSKCFRDSDSCSITRKFISYSSHAIGSSHCLTVCAAVAHKCSSYRAAGAIHPDLVQTRNKQVVPCPRVYSPQPSTTSC